MSKKQKTTLIICSILAAIVYVLARSFSFSHIQSHGTKITAFPDLLRVTGFSMILGVLFIIMSRCVPKSTQKTAHFILAFIGWTNLIGSIVAIVLSPIIL